MIITLIKASKDLYTQHYDNEDIYLNRFILFEVSKVVLKYFEVKNN